MQLAPRGSVLALATALMLSLPVGAVAQTAPNRQDVERARQRVEQLDERIADAEQELRTVEADLADLAGQLAAANDALATADREATQTQRAARAAKAAAEQVGRDLRAARDELADNQEQLAAFARDTYKYGAQSTSPALAAFEQLASSEGPGELSQTLHMLEAVLGQRVRVVDESTKLLARTAELTEAARRAERERRTQADAASAARDVAAQRHAEVMAIVDATDATVRRQQELLAGLRSERAAASQDVEDLEDAARRAAEAAAAAVAATPLGGGLVSVGGITVAESLAPQLESLLEAARGDGIVLSGSGYRSPETTAWLRKVNGCPDVYESPASSCRVPTARPGESMHEQGLAVDFTHEGRTICYPRAASSCRGNPAFDWLSGNAARFGLRVLDAEAWHWSTNGN